jgi:predicted HTH domain antitoxin
VSIGLARTRLLLVTLTEQGLSLPSIFCAEVAMPLVISDEALQEAGLTEGDALVEFACRLFDAEKMTLWSAAKLAGLSRVAFEQALRERKIAVYHPLADDLTDDLRALGCLGI